MDTANKNGPVINPGLCRCCGSIRKCRLLNVEYEYKGEKEVYSDMLMDCFGLVMSHLDSKERERVICALCVGRLREAYTFRRQVLYCEESFLQMKLYDCSSDPVQFHDIPIDIKEEPLEKPKKIECDPDDPSYNGDSYDISDAVKSATQSDNSSDDDVPLIKQQKLKKKTKKDTKLKRKTKKVLSMKSEQKENKSQLDNQPSTAPKSIFSRPLNPLVRKRLLQRKALLKSQARHPEVFQSKSDYEDEKDKEYMAESNAIIIVEFSYVIPFKCRHNNYVCYYCSILFTDSDELREHTLKSHTPSFFKRFIEHKKMTKIDITRIDCRLCPEKIYDLETFKTHIVNVHEKSNFPEIPDAVLPFRLTRGELTCTMCDKTFLYFHALNQHMNEHYSNYMCEICGLGFLDQNRLVMHTSKHQDGMFPCEDCGKVFKSDIYREQHIDRVHKKKGKVYCPKCDERLMTYPQKLKHLVEVHGEKLMTYPCNLCDKVFERRRRLTVHVRRDHLKDFRYECSFCGQKFFTRFCLKNHMPTHTGERNYKCKICEKTYPRLKTLNDHMRIHTNDRRYKCHICGLAFIQNCSLKGHMKSQHPEYG